jgi:Tfp pilus assembly protein PilX
MFPISTDAERFRNARQRRIGGLPEAAQDAIESLQPFHASDPAVHPLALLQELSNRDKHRFLRTVGAAVNKAEMTVGERQNIVIRRYKLTEGLVQDGDELFRATLLSLGKQPRLAIDLQTVYGAAFAKMEPAAGRDAVSALDEVRRHIRDTVFPTLAPYFN